jgi:hypothetical protein
MPNVELGPALRVNVTASYTDERYPPTIGAHIIPALAPNETSLPILLNVNWRDTSPPEEEIRLDGFPISGEYRDRSQQNTYPIISDWDAT